MRTGFWILLVLLMGGAGIAASSSTPNCNVVTRGFMPRSCSIPPIEPAEATRTVSATQPATATWRLRTKVSEFEGEKRCWIETHVGNFWAWIHRESNEEYKDCLERLKFDEKYGITTGISCSQTKWAYFYMANRDYPVLGDNNRYLIKGTEPGHLIDSRGDDGTWYLYQTIETKELKQASNIRIQFHPFNSAPFVVDISLNGFTTAWEALVKEPGCP